MKVKEIVLSALFVSVLLVSQLALSSLNGIELVTVILASIAFYFGFKIGLITVNVFIILRAFIFGFFPSVMVLYFVYYNLFVVLFNFVGYKANRDISIKAEVFTLITAVIMTIMFTVLDNIITPLWFSFNLETTRAYCLMSLTAVIPQVICTIITVFLIFPILIKLYKKVGVKNNGNRLV